MRWKGVRKWVVLGTKKRWKRWSKVRERDGSSVVHAESEIMRWKGRDKGWAGVRKRERERDSWPRDKAK